MFKLTKSIKAKVESHAQGSLYRMNAGSADCYAFSLYRKENGKLDFEGGWDWSNRLVDKNAEYLYMMDTKEFKRLQ